MTRTPKPASLSSYQTTAWAAAGRLSTERFVTLMRVLFFTVWSVDLGISHLSGWTARGRHGTRRLNATNPHCDCTSDGLDDLDGFSPLYSTYAVIVGPIVNENSVHPPCTHRAPKPHAIAANATQVERRRNPHFMGISRTGSYVV